MPLSPFTTTAVIWLPNRPAMPSPRISSIVIATVFGPPHTGHQAPARDIVPCPTCWSWARRWAALP
ncbi:MAG: hypothetical protein V1771_06005, partial [Chloroflexota bacterium]